MVSILVNSGIFCPIVLFIRWSRLRMGSSNYWMLWLCLFNFELIIWYSWSSSMALNFLSSFLRNWYSWYSLVFMPLVEVLAIECWPVLLFLDIMLWFFFPARYWLLVLLIMWLGLNAASLFVRIEELVWLLRLSIGAPRAAVYCSKWKLFGTNIYRSWSSYAYCS